MDGVHIETCLGDLFSVEWMEDTEVNDPIRETLQEQYDKVKKETTASNVMQYGDLKITQEKVASFAGNYNEDTPSRAFLKTVIEAA